MIDFASWDLAALREAWRNAQPFRHLVIDQLVDESALPGMVAAAHAEPHWPNRSEIFEFYGSSLPIQQPSLRAFADAFGSPAGLAALTEITGAPLTRVETRSYVYPAGGYLLPHLDHQAGLGRKLAYAFYMAVPGEGGGGELDLYEVELDGPRIVDARIAKSITPVANRIAIFEVSDRSLHQVREVLSGVRISLAGWFYE